MAQAPFTSTAWAFGGLAAAFLGVVAYGVWLEDFQRTFLAEILVWGVFALSVSLVFGVGGMLSFAQALYFGAGCWGYNLAVFGYGLTGWAPVAAGVAAALAFAAPTGFVATRVRQHHTLIVTVILSVLVSTVLASGHWRWIAGPYVTRSLPEAPALPLGAATIDYADEMSAFLATTALVFAACLLALLLIRSPFGLAMKAVRENEAKAALLGYDVRLLRWLMFVASAGFAGFAGVLYLMLSRYSNLEFFDWTYSARAMVMAALGGLGTLVGPFVGAAVYYLAAEHLSRFFEQFMILVGVLLLVLVRFMPEGLWGGAVRMIRNRALR
ncbi:branched-chain amino acid ABC transporter permease [Methylopila henanensis]|uniref:Branched-chain amino acid ABC transporter permease n=1 Tax=Methylopila henanensis TaxID=873516 RepID=A0ABW4K4K3_9HYPH